VRRVRVHLADRVAIFALTFGLAARSDERGAFRCRRCDGPLPASEPPRAVERCVYCASDNVTGLRIHRALERTTRQDRELETVLVERRKVRLRARVMYALAVAVVVYGFVTSKKAPAPPITKTAPSTSTSASTSTSTTPR
jgi:hypothetical protein